MNNVKALKTLLVTFYMSFSSLGSAGVDRIDPPNWWAGMAASDLQLMVYGNGMRGCQVSTNYPGVAVDSVTRGESQNYLFINLTLAEAVKPGGVDLQFVCDGKVLHDASYPLLARREGSSERQGFSSKDVIYLVVPDRFANGDPSNDQVAGIIEGPDRSDDYGRHGGDIQGIIDHLDYLEALGVTQLWLTPVLENNYQHSTYHGYAISDLYAVDPRMGSNALYAELADKAAEKGIGIIHDLVLNHISIAHPWIGDIPEKDWVHHDRKFVRTNDRHEAIIDPHASASDKERMVTGWFDHHMPDLDQRNPLLARYLQQNAIWWVETAGLSGFRIDTWPYLHASFMPGFIDAVMSEYPNLNIVGEETDWNARIVSYWQRGKKNADGFHAGVPSMMDFPLTHAIIDAFSEEESWNTGLSHLYRTLANDSVYADSSNLIVFADNHDRDRFLTAIDDQLDRFKMGIIFLMTTRGIPQIYYGTELAASHRGQRGDGIRRSDFPGGWAGDRKNAFTGERLSTDERDTLKFFQKLLNWRKTAPAIHDGRLVHFGPLEGIYAYFRIADNQTIMVLINNAKTLQSVDFQRFKEVIGASKMASNVLESQMIDLTKPFSIPKKSAVIFELQ